MKPNVLHRSISNPIRVFLEIAENLGAEHAAIFMFFSGVPESGEDNPERYFPKMSKRKFYKYTRELIEIGYIDAEQVDLP